ncbi:MAG TPA: hypothetical protein VGN00_00515 [Puia sp.]|jgi:hypothetical protein
MSKQYYSLVFIVAACLLLSLLYCPPVDIPGGDKEVFRYGGLTIIKGAVPYRDFFDHKPPLIFFLNTTAFVFGEWGFWLIDFGLVLLATLAFFRLCQRFRLPYPWLLPLLFNLMLRDFLLEVGMGMTREYTVIFGMLFFCVTMGRLRYKYFLMGLLAGLTFFMQQEQSLALVPFLIYALLTDLQIPLIRRIIQLGLGFLVIALPLLLYFALHHSLEYLWKDAFLFNFQWYTAQKKSMPDHFRTIKEMLDRINYEVPFMIAVTLGTASLLLKHKKKGLLIAALIGVSLSLSQEFMGRRAENHAFEHYFMPLSASICILLFVVFAFTEEAALLDRRVRPIYGFLLCGSLGYTALQHGTHLKLVKDDSDISSPVYGYLREHTIGDYQLFLMGDSYFIHAFNEKRILSPSPWIYQHFWKWYPKWDPDQALLKGIGEDILKHRTTYIVVDDADVARFINPANSGWWFAFLRDHYNPISIAGPPTSISLWKIKDIP